MIPKIIYVFWEGEMNIVTSVCFENIKRMNPDFEMKLLSSDTIQNKPDNYDNLEIQHKSDWARIEAIAETGGVWIDIHCIVLKPFETWIDFTSDSFHGFEVPFGCDVIENWAFAAPKGCPIINAWKNEFKKAIEMGFTTYNKHNDIHECLKSSLPYLTMHQALHVALKNVHYPDMKIMKSTDKNMPFHLIEKCKWNNYCFVKKLKSEKHLDDFFLKMTGPMSKRLLKQGVRKMNECEIIDKHKYSHVERVLGIIIKKDNIFKSFLITIITLSHDLYNIYKSDIKKDNMFKSFLISIFEILNVLYNKYKSNVKLYFFDFVRHTFLI